MFWTQKSGCPRYHLLKTNVFMFAFNKNVLVSSLKILIKFGEGPQILHFKGTPQVIPIVKQVLENSIKYTFRNLILILRQPKNLKNPGLALRYTLSLCYIQLRTYLRAFNVHKSLLI